MAPTNGKSHPTFPKDALVFEDSGSASESMKSARSLASDLARWESRLARCSPARDICTIRATLFSTNAIRGTEQFLLIAVYSAPSCVPLAGCFREIRQDGTVRMAAAEWESFCRGRLTTVAGIPKQSVPLSVQG